MMALLSEGRADEKAPIHRGADGRDPAGGREVERGSSGQAHQVSEQTIYAWRQDFAGMEPSDVMELKALESENAKLKKLLAERDLEIDAMREVNRIKS
jgi:putative transposase